ncbi:hypothetical protein JST99_02210 [Candidatus Dependentiae bacterium]|nr:hypothetical protein [Candidatus Dependentiae bacterium]MCC7415491.1 hypothetical protein [Campylobacterota bacterium]
MIAIRHSFLAIVGVVLLYSNDVVGWILPIGNATPYVTRVEVAYPGCRSDRIVLAPGQQINVNAAGCLVNQIGMVFEKAQPGNPPKDVSLNWQVSGHRDFWATLRKKADGTLTLEADYGKGPIQQAFVKPIVETFNQLGDEVKDAIAPIEKAFSKESFEKLGNDINKEIIKPIETTFVKLGKDIEKGFLDFGALFQKEVINPVVAAGDVILSKFKDCSQVVALGSEWAAKKSAFESAQGALLVVNEINEADPLQYGVIAVQEAALLGLDAGKLGAEGLAHMMEGIGAIIGGGFNITEVSFDVQAADLVQGKLPLFQIKGFFFGKACNFTFQFDVNNPEKSMESIVKELIKIVPGV